MRQHLQVGLLGVLAGIDAELVGEVLPQRVVGRERVGGAAAAVQGVHEHHGRAFPGGVAAHERLQFGDGVRGSAEPHQRFEAVLDGPRAQLVEPPGLGRGELEVGELGEGVAAPQRQPGVEPLQRGRVVVGRGGAPRRAEVLLEGGGVERGAVEREDVAGGLEAQPLPRPERAPQPGGVGAQRGHRAGRRRLAPERDHQAVGGHDPARLDQQGREQRPRLGAAERDRTPVVLDRERAQHPELHTAAPQSA